MERFRVTLEALQAGRTAPTQLLKRSMERIAKLNPRLKSVISLYQEDVLKKAASKCDGDGGVCGMPILVKESFNVKGLPTTLASRELTSLSKDTFRAPRAADADVVARLRAKGAIILGKTNIPERGMDVQTFNEMHGTTNNPWDLSLTPGGSSGGSAAAVAAGIVPIALGADLAGSLRIPAAFCGVSSLRPTWGRVPHQGHVPPVPSGLLGECTTRVGALTVDCDAQAAFMQAVCEDYDEALAKPPPPTSTTICITPALPKTPTDQRIVNHLATTLPGALTAAGFRVSVREPPRLDYDGLKKAHTAFSNALMGTQIDTIAMKNAEMQRQKAITAIGAFLGQQMFWALPVVCSLPFPHNPTHQPMALQGVDSPVSYWKAMLSYVTFLTVTSFPVLTLPVGLVEGLPIGIQVVGRIGDDEKLIGFGRSIESVYPPLAPPMKWAE